MHYHIFKTHRCEELVVTVTVKSLTMSADVVLLLEFKDGNFDTIVAETPDVEGLISDLAEKHGDGSYLACTADHGYY